MIVSRPVVTEMTHSQSEIDRRRARRVTYEGRVLFLDDDWHRGVGFMQNLSNTGCAMISDSPLQIGMELQLSLVAASDERDIVIEMAKVRWMKGNCYGLEFLGIDPLERERLRLFLKTRTFRTFAASEIPG